MALSPELIQMLGVSANIGKSLFTGLGGAQDAIDGAGISLAGAGLQAQAFRNAGSQAQIVANYNAALEQVQFRREQDAVSRSIKEFTSKNLAAQTTTGFEVGSKSFQSVVSQNLGSFEKLIIQQRNNNEYKQRAILFEGASKAAAFENRARAAIFQGQVQAFQALQQRQKGLMGMATNVLSLGLGFL